MLHTIQTSFLVISSNFSAHRRQNLRLFSQSILKSIPWSKRVVLAAASSTEDSSSGSDLNPYEVLGVSSIHGFDKAKAAYRRKRKDAEIRGDEEMKAKLEKAYDTLMMLQLTNRKQGVTSGAFKVSKDIKYADKKPLLPWAPRVLKSSTKDMYINLALSAVFTAWVLIKRNAQWKPLQFSGFLFVYRLFEKLQEFEAPVSQETEGFEDERRTSRMGKLLIRSVALVMGCIAAAALAYTGLLNIIEGLGSYIPAVLYNNQEVFVTTLTTLGLYFMASYYR